MLVQLIGAGIFHARITRSSQTLSESKYEVSLSTRTCPETGTVQFSAADVSSFAKLLQLLLFEIELDGNASSVERSILRSLGNHIELAMKEFESEMKQNLSAALPTENHSATSNS